MNGRLHPRDMLRSFQAILRHSENRCGPHTVGVRATVGREVSGPAAADGGVGAAHVVARGLDFLAVAVGLFVDGLEVTAQLGETPAEVLLESYGEALNSFVAVGA